MKLKYIFFILFVFTLLLNAGVRMVTEYTIDNKMKDKSTFTAYIEKDRMRNDIKGKKEDISIIFRGDKKLFWMLDHREKTYTEMTKADLDKLQKSISEKMQKMEEGLKILPPEQRKQIEELMKGEMKTTVPKLIYKKVATAQKVNQWICDKYEGYKDKEKEEDVWITDWQKIGLKPEDLKVMEEMGKFLSGMLKSFSPPIYKIDTAEKGFSGIPIKTIGYESGKPVYTSELKEIKRESFSSSLFELPKGYKKEKLSIEEEKEDEE